MRFLNKWIANILWSCDFLWKYPAFTISQKGCPKINLMDQNRQSLVYKNPHCPGKSETWSNPPKIPIPVLIIHLFRILRSPNLQLPRCLHLHLQLLLKLYLHLHQPHNPPLQLPLRPGPVSWAFVMSHQAHCLVEIYYALYQYMVFIYEWYIKAYGY